MKRLILLCGIAALLTAPAASASGSSVSVNQTGIHWGDTVTFSYSTNVANPWIQIMCVDGTNGVINNGNNISYQGPAGSSFTLTNQFAQPGGGNCTAWLGSINKRGDFKSVAWTQFLI